MRTAVFGAIVAFGVVAAARRVFGIVEAPSWPPEPDAITADGAEAAVAQFVSRPVARPSDVGMPYAWSTAATIEPWPEGRSFFPRIFDDVRAARSSVHVLMYGWRGGEIGSAFADLLLEKLEQGVEVRVLVDAQGSRTSGASRPMFTRLADAGAQIVINTLLPWDDLGRVDHRKLYLVDGTVAWIGGAGLEDHFENGEFHDVMVRVTGDIVRQAQALFMMSFHGHGGVVPGDLAPFFPSQPERGTLPAALLQVAPGGFQSATQAMRALIDEATTRVDVMNPYVTDGDMLARLEAAARRGVRVRIVVSEKSNNALATASFRYHCRTLLDAGAEIYEYPGAVVHAKVMIADDSVVFGTVNIDAWALYRNYEVAMLVRDAETVERFEERIFGPDIARCRAAEAAHGFGARLPRAVWDRLAYLL